MKKIGVLVLLLSSCIINTQRTEKQYTNGRVVIDPTLSDRYDENYLAYLLKPNSHHAAAHGAIQIERNKAKEKTNQNGLKASSLLVGYSGPSKFYREFVDKIKKHKKFKDIDSLRPVGNEDPNIDLYFKQDPKNKSRFRWALKDENNLVIFQCLLMYHKSQVQEFQAIGPDHEVQNRFKQFLKRDLEGLGYHLDLPSLKLKRKRDEKAAL